MAEISRKRLESDKEMEIERERRRQQVFDNFFNFHDWKKTIERPQQADYDAKMKESAAETAKKVQEEIEKRKTTSRRLL